MTRCPEALFALVRLPARRGGALRTFASGLPALCLATLITACGGGGGRGGADAAATSAATAPAPATALLQTTQSLIMLQFSDELDYVALGQAMPNSLRPVGPGTPATLRRVAAGLERPAAAANANGWTETEPGSGLWLMLDAGSETGTFQHYLLSFDGATNNAGYVDVTTSSSVGAGTTRTLSYHLTTPSGQEITGTEQMNLTTDANGNETLDKTFSFQRPNGDQETGSSTITHASSDSPSIQGTITTTNGATTVTTTVSTSTVNGEMQGTVSVNGTSASGAFSGTVAIGANGAAGGQFTMTSGGQTYQILVSAGGQAVLTLPDGQVLNGTLDSLRSAISGTASSSGGSSSSTGGSSSGSGGSSSGGTSSAGSLALVPTTATVHQGQALPQAFTASFSTGTAPIGTTYTWTLVGGGTSQIVDATGVPASELTQSGSTVTIASVDQTVSSMTLQVQAFLSDGSLLGSASSTLSVSPGTLDGIVPMVIDVQTQPGGGDEYFAVVLWSIATDPAATSYTIHGQGGGTLGMTLLQSTITAGAPVVPTLEPYSTSGTPILPAPYAGGSNLYNLGGGTAGYVLQYGNAESTAAAAQADAAALVTQLGEPLQASETYVVND